MTESARLYAELSRIRRRRVDVAKRLRSRNQVLGLFVLWSAAALSIAQPLPAQAEIAEDTPLRTVPLNEVVADLNAFIPEVMDRYAIPGVSVALIRDNEIAWAQAFGIANTLTRDPLTVHTILPVASVGKPAAAHTAMQLVQAGDFLLDMPPGDESTRQWLPDPESRSQITLRHLLAHTSGLSNFLGDKTRAVRFPPGQEFSYSGVGFMYLQHVLEQNSGESLDAISQRETFEPFGMTSSWFGSDAKLADAHGHGHVMAGRAIVPFGIVFVPLAALAILVNFAMSRIITGAWGLSRRMALLGAGVGAAAAALFLVVKASDPRQVPFFVAVFAVYVIAFAAPAWAISRLISANAKPGIATVLRPVTYLATAGILLGVLAGQPIPVPDVTRPQGNAASSLHSTPVDVAKLALGLGGSSAAATQMRAPQVSVSEHLRWGLGVGIQESEAGRALFHWGRNPSIRSAFVFYPEQGIGAVVIVNLGDVGEAAEEIISRAIGGPNYWATE